MFDLDFHVLTPAGQVHVYSLVAGKVVVPEAPLAATTPVAAVPASPQKVP